VLDALRAEVRELQLRVARLEQRGDRMPAEVPILLAGEPDRGVEAFSFSDGVSTFGRALLGIAGAYMLRALTEIGLWSTTAGVGAGLAYAGLWLWLATRTRPEKQLAVVVNTTTSLLILWPLVWEATLKFGVISTATAAAVVAGFALAAQALAWQNKLAIVAGLGSFASAFIAMVLLLGTHDLLPFVFALLAIAAGAEFAALSGRATGARWWVAGLTDLAMLTLAWLVSRQGGLPEGYAPAPLARVFAAQILMMAIYIASTVTETVARNSRFTPVRVIQAGTALLLGLGGIYAVAKANPSSVVAVGVVVLFGAAGCYSISFRIREDGKERSENAAVYGWFGFFLALAAGLLLFSSWGQMAVWTSLAVAAGWAQRSFRWGGLQIQDAGFLLVASAVSGSWEAARLQLFGDGTAPVPGFAVGWLFVATVLWYLPAHLEPEIHSRQRFSMALIGANFMWLAAGAGSHWLILAWRGFAAGTGIANQGAQVPSTTVATAALICLSLGLAVCGVKWRRRELIWVVYGAMALGAFKLATMDFAYATTLPLVVSLLFYGGALILLPRILAKNNS